MVVKFQDLRKVFKDTAENFRVKGHIQVERVKRRQLQH